MYVSQVGNYVWSMATRSRSLTWTMTRPWAFGSCSMPLGERRKSSLRKWVMFPRSIGKILEQYDSSLLCPRRIEDVRIVAAVTPWKKLNFRLAMMAGLKFVFKKAKPKSSMQPLDLCRAHLTTRGDYGRDFAFKNGQVEVVSHIAQSVYKFCWDPNCYPLLEVLDFTIACWDTGFFKTKKHNAGTPNL